MSKTRKKIKIKSLLIALILLAGIVIGSFFAYDKFINKNENKENKENVEKPIEDPVPEKDPEPVVEESELFIGNVS